MRLDYNPAKDAFVLYVDRGEADPHVLMHEFGLKWSSTASTQATAVLFTMEPYAAASFAQYANERASHALLDITTAIAASWAEDSDRHIDMPDGVELWPFQKASVAYALDRPHALVGDQPGLGKTITAIAVANEMQADRILVVCPASIRDQWDERMKEWALGDKSSSVVRSGRRGIDEKSRWTFISWDLVRSPGLWRALAHNRYDLLVLDEAHYAKHYDAKRTRSIFGGGKPGSFKFEGNEVAAPPCLMDCSERVLALTGTPLPKRPKEAYTLARHLSPDSIDFMSQDDFEEKYNYVHVVRNREGTVVAKDEHVGNEAELQNRMRGNFMVRHLKRTVMPQLKLPVFDLIRVDETGAVKAALAAERLLDIDPETLEGKDAFTLGHIAEARRLMGIAMAPQVAEYVAMLIDEGVDDKLVLFAWHIEVMDILQARLADYGLLRVDGRDGAKAKYKKVYQFISDPAARIILGNVLSLGTGTDGLQHVACHGLMAEADWTHGNNEQCADRLDRGGQTRQVSFDIFVAPGSLSEKVLAASLRDAQITNKALDRRVGDIL